MTAHAGPRYRATTWGALVQSTGNEVSVTLLVHGTLVSGFLTAPCRYADWEARSVEICRVMGNGGQDNTAAPPTAAEVLLIQERWADEHGGEDFMESSPAELCLRNAMVAAPMAPLTFAYLLVDVSSVGAFTLGAAQLDAVTPDVPTLTPSDHD